MSKTVFFKFRSSLTKYEIPFEGSSISTLELKQAINKKFLFTKYDLTFILKDTVNNIDRECSENELIPAFSNLIVIRTPIVSTNKPIPNSKTINPENFSKTDPYKNMNNRGVGELIKNMNLSTSDMTDEQKLDKMIVTGGNNSYKHTNKKTNKGCVPITYLCNKCGIPGHWIDECPGVPDKNGKLIDSRLVKRPSGIPVCGLVEVYENTPNSYLSSDGRYVANIKNLEAAKKGKKEKRPFSIEENPPLEKPQTNIIPSYLLCGLCCNLLVQPVIIPCCKVLFCEKCITERLFVQNNAYAIHTCPKCYTKVDKLESLKDAQDSANLVSEWLKGKANKTNMEEIVVKPELVRKKPSEMTDDDLLNEILCNDDKENDLPEKRNLIYDDSSIKKEEMVIKSEEQNGGIVVENLTNIFKQIAEGGKESELENLLKNNPQVMDIFTGLVKQIVPYNMMGANVRERSRSRQRYNNHQQIPAINNDYGHYRNNINCSRYNDYQTNKIREERDSFRPHLRMNNEERSTSRHYYDNSRRYSKYNDDEQKWSNHRRSHRSKDKHRRNTSEDYHNTNNDDHYYRKRERSCRRSRDKLRYDDEEENRKISKEKIPIIQEHHQSQRKHRIDSKERKSDNRDNKHRHRHKANNSQLHRIRSPMVRQQSIELKSNDNDVNDEKIKDKSHKKHKKTKKSKHNDKKKHKKSKHLSD